MYPEVSFPSQFSQQTPSVSSFPFITDPIPTSPYVVIEMERDPLAEVRPVKFSHVEGPRVHPLNSCLL